MEKDLLKKNIQENLFKLRRLRDEINLEVHLGEMEAKERWRRLEPMVGQAEKLAGEVSEVSRKALSDMVDKFRAFAESIRRENQPHA